MLGRSAPTFQIMRGVEMGRGLHKYTHGGFLSLEKNFEKKFGGYKIYVLPLVGGWVCLYKKRKNS